MMSESVLKCILQIIFLVPTMSMITWLEYMNHILNFELTKEWIMACEASEIMLRTVGKCSKFRNWQPCWFSLDFIIMSPYSHWVHPSFRQTLVDYCDEFLQSSDQGTKKTRSKCITQVAQEITDIVKGAEWHAHTERLGKGNTSIKCHRLCWWLMFAVCPHMVWELCLWKYQRGKGG
jgi:hypothetical protein